MSFAIVDGKPATMKQKILDQKLDELVAETGREEDRYNFCKLLFKCLRDQPNIINSVDASTGKTITNGEMLKLAVKTARALKAAGIRTGDVVMIIGVNHLELAIPYYAAFFNGNLPINLDGGVTGYELDNFVKVTKPKIIFCDDMKMDIVKESLCNSGVKAAIVTFGGESSRDVDTFSEFMRPFNDDVNSFRAADRNRDDPALILTTSGSTGLPKMPVMTHYGLLAQLPIFSTPDVRQNELKFKLGTAKNLLFTSSQWITYYRAIASGAVYGAIRVQTPLRLTIEHALQMLRTQKPHSTLVSPNFLSLLLSHPDYKHGDLQSLYIIFVTGATISQEMQEQVKEEMNPDGMLMYTYGCTEMGGSMLDPNSHRVHGSIGEENNIMYYKIVDDDVKNVSVGETGELLVKPKEPFCKGYYDDEEATKEAFTEDGWYRTGDLIHRNKQGQYFFVDRKNLRISYKNSYVYPAEVESVVRSIPGVADAAVCPSERGPVGIVVKHTGHNLKEQDIHNILQEKLSSFKQLVGGIYFAPALPKTVTGKLDRTKVKQLHEQLQQTTNLRLDQRTGVSLSRAV